MVDGEQTNTPDTKGTEDNKPLESPDKPLSEYDKALALVKMREEASKVELEILARKEKLAADELISGTGGGHVDAPVVSEEKKKVDKAAEFFKGSALGDAIKKANE